MTTKPCAHCGLEFSGRGPTARTCSSECGKVIRAVYLTQYFQAQKAKIYRQRKRYQKANPEAVTAWRRRWKKNNPEKQREAKRRYRERRKRATH